MPSMAVPPPSRANPSRRGIAWEICPRTPPRLQVEYPEHQCQYPRCPKLARPQILPEFTISMGRNYFKQTVALTNAGKEDVYKYEKAENLERRFWCQLHQDFYSSVVMHKGKAPIVSCKYVDWAYFEKMNDPFFNQAIAKCKEFGLYDIMGFRYDWNEEILAHFTPLYFMMQGKLPSFGPPRE
jgi:hypothetical protein